MKASGVVLMVAGVWVLCQVLGGDALGRLGVVASTSGPDGGIGVPRPDDGYGPGFRDGEGRPL